MMNFTLFWVLVYFGLTGLAECTNYKKSPPAHILLDYVQIYTTSHNNHTTVGDLYKGPKLLETHNRVARSLGNIAYWLYTRQNPTQYQLLTLHNIYNSYFDLNKVTVFLVHAWTGSGNFEMNTLLRDAFLQNGDVNVIVVDWSYIARNLLYLVAKMFTAAVGRTLGQFIIGLNSRGLSYQKVHLVGFSLGGQLVGSAGRVTGGQVARITALDPAGPLWLSDPNKLSASDARYVEVIHTNTALYGFRLPLGHADFYPNGGRFMPGCLSNICSHYKAFRYMANSVKYNNLLANQCYFVINARWNTCTGYLYPMGNSDLYKSWRGIFRVNI